MKILILAMLVILISCSEDDDADAVSDCGGKTFASIWRIDTDTFSYEFDARSVKTGVQVVLDSTLTIGNDTGACTIAMTITGSLCSGSYIRIIATPDGEPIDCELALGTSSTGTYMVNTNDTMTLCTTNTNCSIYDKQQI